MTSLSLGEMLPRMSQIIGAPTDALLPPTILARLLTLAAPLEGTVYLEHRFPIIATGQDVIVHVASSDLAAQCRRMANWCTKLTDATRWHALAQLADETAGNAESIALVPHHYWIEFDRTGVNDGPNLFLCHTESRPTPRTTEIFRQAVTRFDRVLGDTSSPAVSAHDELSAVLGNGAFVSYVGFMTARRHRGLRLCVSGLTLGSACASIAALTAPLGNALHRALKVMSIASAEATPALLHLDWIRRRPGRAGVEVQANRFSVMAQQPPTLAALCARYDKHDRRWLEMAVVGGGVYSQLNGAWLAVMRSLNHLKITVGTPNETPVVKAYLRYDWRRASPALRSKAGRMPKEMHRD